jgi:hypothetical protein
MCLHRSWYEYSFESLIWIVLLQEGGKQKVKDEKVYCCCFGPEDNSNNLPPLSKTGPRRRLTEHGEGRKKGCQAEFRAVTYFNDPDQIKIRYAYACMCTIKTNLDCKTFCIPYAIHNPPLPPYVAPGTHTGIGKARTHIGKAHSQKTALAPGCCL